MTTPDLRDQLQAALGASYVLERELGRGGMATVFLALDAKHHRRVALKVLHPDLASALGPERFRREIELAAQLQHPHILSVHDSGETAGGLLWFTMPYVEGESLRERLRRERQLAVDAAVRITREVARALDYAHEHGVIHRDIKPENVLVTRQGDALLADFGIARALAVGGAASEPGGSSLTGTGLTVGTPQYMSPEQASGERELTARSDIYSLGAVVYEMLAGEPPFTGPTPQAVIAKMLSSEPPSVRRSRPAVPEAVDAAVRKALAPVPADRWASAGGFAAAVDAAERTASAPPARRRRVPVAALTLGLGFLVGVGVLFAWRSHIGGAASAAGPIRIAVLPFDNLGDSADAYFADGLTDAVRGKLAGVPGIEVIGSASSAQYRKTAKTPQQIGQELGVRYLLTAKVRWDKHAGAISEVQVSPELLEAASAAEKWAQPFDAPLTHVFEVQADIAGKVAQQLKVALTPAAEQSLAQRPTNDLTAYDAYLRGDQLLSRRGLTPEALSQAAGFYREAVRRDSTFAVAWAALAEACAYLYGNYGLPTVALADSADASSARAVALAPDLAAAHTARALYYSEVLVDGQRSLAESQAAVARAPTDPHILSQIADGESRFGSPEAGIAHLEQAARLDPRDVRVFLDLGYQEIAGRHYDAAHIALDHAAALEPENLVGINARIELAVAQGDLAGARTVLHTVPPSVSPATVAAIVATFGDMGWALDSAYEKILFGLGPDAFGGDRRARAFALAQQYAFHGDRTRSRLYADSARLEFEAQIKASPPGAQHGEQDAELGVALAYLGRKSEAIRAGERAVALVPVAKDAQYGPYDLHQLARIYTVVGEPEKALDQLELLLRGSSELSPASLRIDPNFAPLHGNPRFERLIASN